MTKAEHEIRCPIHVFIRPDSDELRVIDSLAVQRLRDIHQLALTGLVYPAASHKRFEHCLGVFELAGRIFDVLTHPGHIHPAVATHFAALNDQKQRARLRQTVRLAALCHDTGHLPFSHAAEKRLLPPGWTHESLTRELILNSELTARIESQDLRIDPMQVAKFALGRKEAPDDWEYEPYEEVLAEITVGDVFGADRMDYLLRDAYHLGVSYGRFDHHRLVNTLRILPAPPEATVDAGVPMIGVERGGIQSAEALLWARYQMYSQVYFHRTRKILDEHLADFMVQWLEVNAPDGKYPTTVSGHLAMTDSTILAAARQAVLDANAPGHQAANCLLQRQHYRELYTADLTSPDSGRRVFDALIAAGIVTPDQARHVRIPAKQRAPVFPVLDTDGYTCLPSTQLSLALTRMPEATLDSVYVEPSHLSVAQVWLRTNGVAAAALPEEAEP